MPYASTDFISKDLYQIYEATLSSGVPTLTENEVLFGDAAGAIAQDSLFIWNDTTKRLGVGITPTVRLHVKGEGATSATSSLKLQNSANAPIAEFKDDLTTNISGNVIFNKTAGTNTVFNWAGQVMGIINMNNNGGVSWNDNTSSGQGSFSANGKNGSNQALGTNSTTFGRNNTGNGTESLTHGYFGHSDFDNQYLHGCGLNTPNGHSHVVKGLVTGNIAQNTDITIAAYNFSTYLSSATAVLAKVKFVTFRSDGLGGIDVQQLVETFSFKLIGGAISQLGAAVNDYTYADAALSTGQMVYSFAGTTLTIKWKTPTVIADSSYSIQNVFEFDMIGN
jgi:hypothetical protein